MKTPTIAEQFAAILEQQAKSNAAMMATLLAGLSPSPAKVENPLPTGDLADDDFEELSPQEKEQIHRSAAKAAKRDDELARQTDVKEPRGEREARLEAARGGAMMIGKKPRRGGQGGECTWPREAHNHRKGSIAQAVPNFDTTSRKVDIELPVFRGEPGEMELKSVPQAFKDETRVVLNPLLAAKYRSPLDSDDSTRTPIVFRQVHIAEDGTETIIPKTGGDFRLTTNQSATPQLVGNLSAVLEVSDDTATATMHFDTKTPCYPQANTVVTTAR